ncbi:MAG: hypothetical protein F6K18_07220 [Okeania sp. SIO2C2]|uniref:hypothetical protein n=1 Tax=Okeania sp. SIO2C2 TaxID=2607787 RepID=UPI0013B81013|nr:hypothetical protein [Okeania sp. SIO2C2]NEP86638.1 hypothetical protein [Okeania sp. SIO2C2]
MLSYFYKNVICGQQFYGADFASNFNPFLISLKKETGDNPPPTPPRRGRQETGGKLHGDSLPQVMREHPR